MDVLCRCLVSLGLAVLAAGALGCGGIVERDPSASDGSLAGEDADGDDLGPNRPGRTPGGGASGRGTSPGAPGNPGGPGSPGSGAPVETCTCATPGSIVLSNASGEFVFDQPPDPAIYPELTLGCAPSGATYVAEHCERRASVSGCSVEHGCLRLAPRTSDADAQLTWFRQEGTSVLQVRGEDSTVVIEEAGATFSGWFAFVESGNVMHEGKFSGCILEDYTCD